MPLEEYQVSPYSSDMKDGVVDLFTHLVGTDPVLNEEYFRWKYELNPLTRSKVGIVALIGDKVVGFRGFLPQNYSINDLKLKMLCVGDTCVHPDHRKRGLSVEMGHVAMREYSSDDFFLNLTCGENTLPGYLRLGFVPITIRTKLYRLGIMKMGISYLKTPGTGKEIKKDDVRLIETGRVLPEEMSRMGRRGTTNMIQLDTDQEYIRWRYSNPRGSYVFYYCFREDEITGYVSAGVTQNGRQTTILDYDSSDRDSMRYLLDFLVRKGGRGLVSVYSFSLSEEMRNLLRDMNFRKKVPLSKKRMVMPMLLRPVDEVYSEDSWFQDGLDVRDIANWSIRKISSDSA